MNGAIVPQHAPVQGDATTIDGLPLPRKPLEAASIRSRRRIQLQAGFDVAGYR
jgi:hypothetical protein